MKKILLGLSAIAVVLSLVAGTAYALFSSAATVSGFSVTAAGPENLLVGGAVGGPFTGNWDSGFSLTGLKPGYGVGFDHFESMFLQNDSTDTDFSVTMKLTAAATGWGTYLSYATQVDVKDVDSSAHTGWKSLQEWNAGEVTLPGGPIVSSDIREYVIYVRVPLTYGSEDGGYAGFDSITDPGDPVGNEIQTESLTGVTFTVTGTQVL